jgi:hypothetical protein
MDCTILWDIRARCLGRNLLSFQISLLSSLVSESTRRVQPRLVRCLLPDGCLIYSSTLEVEDSSETSMNLCCTSRHAISGERIISATYRSIRDRFGEHAKQLVRQGHLALNL